MIFAAVQAFFGLSIIQLLPAVASVELKGNADTLGRLLGAAGAGALIGIIVILPFVQRIKRPCLAIGGALVWSGIWYVLFSFTHSLWLAMVCQCMSSLGAANVVTLSFGLSQELTPPNMRARIESVFLMIIFGLQPVASYLVGAGADRFGLKSIMRINGILMIVIPALLIALTKLRHVKRAEEPAFKKAHPVGF